MAALPRWLYGDPAEVADRLRGMGIDTAPQETKQERAAEGLKALFKEGTHDSKAQVKNRNSAG